MSNQVDKLEGDQVRNPYALAEASRPDGPGTSLAQADSHRAMIEVMTQYEVAKRFPRDMILASDRIIKECSRPTLAGLAVYEYPRGKETITGPTIRLLECIARALGNINFGWVEVDRSKSASTIRAFAIDMESNMRSEKTFTVRHWRDLKGGKGYALTDERDIYELQANQASRRVRSCIEALVPRDVIDMALDQVEITNQNSIDLSPEGIAKLLKAFAAYGVNQAMIEALFEGMKIEALRAPQIMSLRKKYASLKEGIARVADFFDTSLADSPEQPDPKGTDEPSQPDLAKAVEEKKSETAKAAETPKAAESGKEEKAPADTKASAKQEPPKLPIVEQIRKDFNEAPSLKRLDELVKEVYGEILQNIYSESEDAYYDLTKVADARKKELEAQAGKLI